MSENDKNGDDKPKTGSVKKILAWTSLVGICAATGTHGLLFEASPFSPNNSTMNQGTGGPFSQFIAVVVFWLLFLRGLYLIRNERKRPLKKVAKSK